MSPPDDLGPMDYPAWLRDVAVRVDELVSDVETLERFRRMVCDWKAERIAHGPKYPFDKHGRVQYDRNPIELLTVRRTKLPEKYAWLAAIHDTICEDTKNIDPWHSSRTRPRYDRRKLSIAYVVLKGCVQKLGTAERPHIAGVLRSVERDLAECKMKIATDNAGAPKSPTANSKGGASGVGMRLDARHGGATGQSPVQDLIAKADKAFYEDVPKRIEARKAFLENPPKAAEQRDEVVRCLRYYEQPKRDRIEHEVAQSVHKPQTPGLTSEAFKRVVTQGRVSQDGDRDLRGATL